MNSGAHRHHAILLISKHLGPALPLAARDFRALVSREIGVELRPPGDFGQEEEFWDEASAHPDIWIAPRNKTNLNLDDMAGLRERSHFPPQMAFRRLFFVDGAHRLTQATANALLKVLEEPPSPSLFLFTARSRLSVLNTLASRCICVHHTSVVPPEQAPPLTVPLQNLSRILWTSRAYLPGCGNSLVSGCLRAAESIVKETSPRELLDFVAKEIANLVLANQWTPTDLRFALSDLRAWEAALEWNGSSDLWLTRFLLSAQTDPGSHRS